MILSPLILFLAAVTCYLNYLETAALAAVTCYLNRVHTAAIATVTCYLNCFGTATLTTVTCYLNCLYTAALATVTCYLNYLYTAALATVTCYLNCLDTAALAQPFWVLVTFAVCFSVFSCWTNKSTFHAVQLDLKKHTYCVSVGLKWTNRKIAKIVTLYQRELFKNIRRLYNLYPASKRLRWSSG
jgi:hypothetical protein